VAGRVVRTHSGGVLLGHVVYSVVSEVRIAVLNGAEWAVRLSLNNMSMVTWQSRPAVRGVEQGSGK
jgi:hypothetical protein